MVNCNLPCKYVDDGNQLHKVGMVTLNNVKLVKFIYQILIGCDRLKKMYHVSTAVYVTLAHIKVAIIYPVLKVDEKCYEKLPSCYTCPKMHSSFLHRNYSYI